MKAAISKTVRHSVATLLGLLAFALLAVPAFAQSTSLMITQFYTGGGVATSSAYRYNYVEIYNAGYTNVPLTNWTIQFQTATGAMATNTSYNLGGTGVSYNNSFNGTLRPGQYLLIQTDNAATGNALPTGLTADLVIQASTLTVAGSAANIANLFPAVGGRLALVNGTTPMTCTGSNPHSASPDPVADFVGWGSATCYEGSAAAAAASGSAKNYRALWRGFASPATGTGNTGLNLCTGDTGNSTDFNYVEIATKSPNTQDQSWTLHNSQSVYHYKSSLSAFAVDPYSAAPTPACGVAMAIPANAQPGGTTSFSVVITPTPASVQPFSGTVDLSQFNLSTQVPLTADSSGTTLLSDVQTIPTGQTLSSYTIPFSVQDSASPAAAVTVFPLKFYVGTPPGVTMTTSNVNFSAVYNKTKSFQYGITPTTTTCTIIRQPTYVVTDGSNNVVNFPWPSNQTTGVVYTVTPTGALSPDCSFTYVGASGFSVTPASQTAKISCPNTSNGKSIVDYTGSPVACPVTAPGSTNCPLATFTGTSSTTYGPLTTPPTNAGTYTATETQVCPSSDPNYLDATAPSSVDLTINALASLTITPNNQNVTVGGAMPTFTYRTSPAGVIPATPPTCGPPAGTDTSHAQSYTITCQGAADPNITSITQSATATLKVTGPPLMVTANDASMYYGGPLPTSFPYTTSPAGVSLATPPTCTTTAAVTSPAGTTYPITCSGGSDPNYTISYTVGTLTVNPAPLAVIADNQLVPENGTLPTLTFTTNPAGVTLATTPTCTTTANLNLAGTYPITCSGGSDPNYNITGYTPGVLTVSAGLVTITADNASMTYGGPLPATFTYHTTPSVTLATPPTCATTATLTSPPVPGGYPITCSGASDPNYNISYTAGTLTVNSLPLTVTADAKSMNYGGPLPAFTFTTNPAGVTLSTLPTCTTTATATSVPGAYAINCSGGSDARYSPITYTAGTLTVSPVPLTVTADDKAMPLGGPLPALTFHTAPAGVTLSTLPTCTTTATTSSAIGAYPITCSGGSDARYSPITYTAGTLTVNGTLTLTTAPGGSSMATITAGQMGTFNLQATGGTGMTGSIAFTCSVVPAPNQINCTVNPNPVTLNGATPVPITVSLSTTGPKGMAASLSGPGIGPGTGHGLPLALALTLTGLLSTVCMARKGRMQWRVVGACAVLLLVMSLSACGGKSNSNSASGGVKTPPGGYTVTVTGTGTNVTQSTTLILNVL